MLKLDIEGVTAAEATGYIVAGLIRKRDEVQAQIAAVSGQGAPAKAPASKPAVAKSTAKKGQMSAEGRDRIIAAQKERWAKKRAEQEAQASGAEAAVAGAE